MMCQKLLNRLLETFDFEISLRKKGIEQTSLRKDAILRYFGDWRERNIDFVLFLVNNSTFVDGNFWKEISCLSIF